MVLEEKMSVGENDGVVTRHSTFKSIEAFAVVDAIIARHEIANGQRRNGLLIRRSAVFYEVADYHATPVVRQTSPVETPNNSRIGAASDLTSQGHRVTTPVGILRSRCIEDLWLSWED